MDMYKLIIIDDEANALQQFCNMMEWKNYGFSLAGVFSESEEPLEYIKNNHVDLVFTDIKMPKYSGIDIAKACHELKTSPYVVFISAYSDFEYARKAIHYNIYDYLVKPFSYSDIENTLIKVYNLLEEKNASNLFASNLEMVEQQFVFSELVLGNIKSVDELMEKLISINLPAFLAGNRCAYINITINNFDEYITNTWKYGKEKLYNAISYLASSKTVMFSSSFAYVNDSFEILAIDIDSDFDAELDKYIETLCTNLRQLLSITDVSIDTKHKGALSDFVLNNDVETENIIDDPIIKRSIDYIHLNYKKDITLDDVAKHISLSRVYFCSYFKKITGENFINELNRYRIEKAKVLLATTAETISAVAEDVGYRSIPYFYKTFTKFTGQTPSEYRSGMRKETE